MNNKDSGDDFLDLCNMRVAESLPGNVGLQVMLHSSIHPTLKPDLLDERVYVYGGQDFYGMASLTFPIFE